MYKSRDGRVREKTDRVNAVTSAVTDTDQQTRAPFSLAPSVIVFADDIDIAQALALNVKPVKTVQTPAWDAVRVR